MVVLRDATFIESPPETVFQFFRQMDEDRHLAWHSEHEAFHYVEGNEIKEGTVAYFDEVVDGERLNIEVRYTDVVPNKRIEFRPCSRIRRLFLPKATLEFESVDGGTRFVANTYLRAGPLKWFPSAKDELSSAERHIREEGDNLKHIVETGEFDLE